MRAPAALRSSRNGAGRVSADGRRIVLVLVLIAAAAVRIGLVERQGLWADELFSLAMATGHSLEHPAALADPAVGDFVETATAVAPAVYSRYLEHDRPPAGPGRVVRAVLRSDTSPPLYYLLLYGWTRLLGTGDGALRGFSLLWAVACVPLVVSLARRLGGGAAMLPAGLLFALSPAGVYYSTEGRMYALLLFLALGFMTLTLDLGRRGFAPGRWLGWVLAGAAGALTHYFFVFVWAAAVFWLLFRPARRAVLTGAGLTVLLILPWYLQLPVSLASWRITEGWLEWRPGGYHPLLTPLLLPWSYLSVDPLLDLGRAWYRSIAALTGVTAILLLGRLRWFVATPGRWLLWLWLAAPGLGLVVFDLWRGTYTVAVPRYAVAGLPAALLLLGLGLGRLRPVSRATLLTAWVALYGIGLAGLYRQPARSYEPYREIGRHLATTAGADDLVLVHSIPSGVAGIARYLARGGAPPGLGFASWVGQLDRRRVPASLETLAAGRERVFLVEIHDVGEPAPEKDWLEENARATGVERFGAGSVSVYLLPGAEAFYSAKSQPIGRQAVDSAPAVGIESRSEND